MKNVFKYCSNAYIKILVENRVLHLRPSNMSESKVRIELVS